MSHAVKPENYYNNVRFDTLNDVTIDNADNILEIGGGTFGTLSTLVDRFQAKGVGIDMIDECEHDNIEIIVGSLNDKDVFDKLGPRKFDLIIANDVLEHLLDPAVVLKQLHLVCNKDANIHISVPNIRQIRAFYYIFFRGTFPRMSSGLFDSTHFNWFCRADIANMVKDAGFEIEKSYMKGRFVPSFLRSGLLAELLGLQTIIIARKN